MGIWEADDIILFIAFMIPGFISIKVYELLFPTQAINYGEKVIDALAYSCINYALLLWPIIAVEQSTLRQSWPNSYALFYLFVLFIAPALWVLAWKWIRERDYFQAMVPHPTQKPWDFVFGQRKTYWIVVTLKDGKKIAGMYGINSFASSAPAEEQLYMEQEWILNDEGGFDRPAEQTAGVIILASEIVSVEFMHSGESGNE